MDLNCDINNAKDLKKIIQGLQNNSGALSSDVSFDLAGKKIDNNNPILSWAKCRTKKKTSLALRGRVVNAEL